MDQTESSRGRMPRDDESMTAWYLANGGRPTERAMALMAEVDRGRERQQERAKEASTRRAGVPPPPEPTGDPRKDAVAMADYRHELRERESEARRKEFEESRAKFAAEREELLTVCRPALLQEYAAWLDGYLANGGAISHVYDYDMPPVWVLNSPTIIPSLYGAHSVQLIVPSDVALSPRDVPRTFHGGCGHSTVHFQREFEVVGDFIPLYRDVRTLLQL